MSLLLFAAKILKHLICLSLYNGARIPKEDAIFLIFGGGDRDGGGGGMQRKYFLLLCFALFYFVD